MHEELLVGKWERIRSEHYMSRTKVQNEIEK